MRLGARACASPSGGIAKGYAVDRAAADPAQAAASPTSSCRPAATCTSRADAATGAGASASAIRAARASDFFAAAEVEDTTFSTSGDYERFVVKDGQRYHHILDPRTGYPAGACRSVTIMAKDAITAEGCCRRSCSSSGPRKGLAFVAKVPDVEAVIVDADNEVHVSPGLKPHLIRISDPTPGP